MARLYVSLDENSTQGAHSTASLELSEGLRLTDSAWFRGIPRITSQWFPYRDLRYDILFNAKFLLLPTLVDPLTQDSAT